jgi:Tfp pilus assembly protein PilO
MLYSRVNIRFCQIYKLILVLFAVFFVQCFSYNPALSAQADIMKTPEAKYYNAEPTEKDKQLVDNAKSNLKDIGENVREKLNLDEPLPESTKEFLNSTQNKLEDTIEPITGKKQGYYQDNIQAK